MVYFLNQNVNERKPIKQILTKILGVGPFLAEGFCRDLGYNPNLPLRELSPKQIAALGDKVIKDPTTPKQEELVRNVYENVKTLAQIRVYRGQRHKAGLPLRGQRTRTNGKTAKRHNRILNRSR